MLQSEATAVSWDIIEAIAVHQHSYTLFFDCCKFWLLLTSKSFFFLCFYRFCYVCLLLHVLSYIIYLCFVINLLQIYEQFWGMDHCFYGFLQGEFYIRRRLFKECGVGLCEEIVFYILGWKMHVYKRCVLRVYLYLEFERANVYIDVLGLWIEIDSLKKKKNQNQKWKERKRVLGFSWVECVRFVYKH